MREKLEQIWKSSRLCQVRSLELILVGYEELLIILGSDKIRAKISEKIISSINDGLGEEDYHSLSGLK